MGSRRFVNRLFWFNTYETGRMAACAICFGTADFRAGTAFSVKCRSLCERPPKAALRALDTKAAGANCGRSKSKSSQWLNGASHIYLNQDKVRYEHATSDSRPTTMFRSEVDRLAR